MSQENVEVVIRLSEANQRRDWDAVFEAYAADIEWEDTSGLWGDWGRSGVARGRDGVRQAWRGWLEVLGEASWEFDEAALDAGDDVVATYRVHARGRGSGAEVDQRLTLIWTVRDGQIARVRAFRDRAEALEAVGLRE